MTEHEYTVSGFMTPDEPGMNLLRDQPAKPFLLRTKLPDRRWRSTRWWLTRWWPTRLRVWLCYWYGHPSRCMERYRTTEVVATDARNSADGVTFDFRSTGNYATSDEYCHLCGWEHHVSV